MRFSITGPVTIDGNGSGPGAGNTIVDGGDLWQLFSVASTATTATFTDLRLQNAFLDARAGGAGAALRTDAAATLLDGVVVTENAIDGLGDGRGAGVFAGNSAGTLTRRGQRHQRQRRSPPTATTTAPASRATPR